jgi:hypothetical protein
VPPFWLNYCHPDGHFDRFAGVVVVESYTHSGGVRGRSGAFAGAHELDAKSARQVPADMIGRLLDYGDIRRLQRAIAPEKPAAAPVRGRPAAKRSVGKR